MSYNFGGCSYPNSEQYHTAVVAEWLSAGGSNSEEFIRETLEENTDEALAEMVIDKSAWFGLTENEDFDLDKLIDAFRRIRREYR